MSEKRNLVPTWKVKVGRSDVDNATFKGTLRRVTVNDPINAVGKAVLEFEASFGGENRKELLKESEFELGNKVEIGLGYKDNVKKVFEGFMTSFEISYTTTKKIVRVVCSNILYKTLNGKKARTFEKKCCSDILKEILREHGIDNDVEEIKIEKEYVSQEDKTDFEYILSTAQKFGMNLSCKESKVYIATDLDKKIKGDTISFEFGHNLISFKGREDVENQISRCTFVGTNCAKNERIEGAAASNDIPLQIGKESLESRVSGEWTSIFKNDTLQSNEEAKTLAKAVLQNVSMNYQRAEAQAEGENGIFPGNRIVIKAVDSRFSGTWLVERVVHDCAKVQGGFTTTVHLKRNKSGDDDAGGSDRSVSAIEQEMVAGEEGEGERKKVEERKEEKKQESIKTQDINSDLYKVGSYQDIKGVKNLDAHHIGQKAIMKKFIANYDESKAPSINVPKLGHTKRHPTRGIISRSSKGITNARQLLARDIAELKRVYPDVPKSAIKKLIDMNKKMYPEMRKK